MLPTHPFSTLKPGLFVLSCNAFFFFTFYCIKFLRAFLLIRSSRAGVIRGLLFYCHHPTYFRLWNTPLPNYLSFSFVLGCFSCLLGGAWMCPRVVDFEGEMVWYPFFPNCRISTRGIPKYPNGSMDGAARSPRLFGPTYVCMYIARRTPILTRWSQIYGYSVNRALNTGGSRPGYMIAEAPCQILHVRVREH